MGDRSPNPYEGSNLTVALEMMPGATSSRMRPLVRVYDGASELARSSVGEPWPPELWHTLKLRFPANGSLAVTLDGQPVARSDGSGTRRGLLSLTVQGPPGTSVGFGAISVEVAR